MGFTNPASITPGKFVTTVVTPATPQPVIVLPSFQGSYRLGQAVMAAVAPAVTLAGIAPGTGSAVIFSLAVDSPTAEFDFRGYVAPEGQPVLFETGTLPAGTNVYLTLFYDTV
jgi:hypothetical protein